MHAIGDRAVRTLLDVYEQVIQENPSLRSGALVLEHGFLADTTQRARSIRLGILVTVQHPLLYTLGSALLEGWGEQRRREIMSARARLDEGATLSASTGYPISPFNLGLSLWGMVTRGTLKVGIQGPEYAIDQYTAVQLYNAAGLKNPQIGEKGMATLVQSKYDVAVVGHYARPYIFSLHFELRGEIKRGHPK